MRQLSGEIVTGMPLDNTNLGKPFGQELLQPNDLVCFRVTHKSKLDFHKLRMSILGHGIAFRNQHSARHGVQISRSQGFSLSRLARLRASHI
jgi:hypothetical protein